MNSGEPNIGLAGPVLETWSVPPPPDKIMECLDAFERFACARQSLPTLIKAGLAHVQFETIDPFLMATAVWASLDYLPAVAEGALWEPILHLSLFSKLTASVITISCKRSARGAIWKAGFTSSWTE